MNLLKDSVFPDLTEKTHIFCLRTMESHVPHLFSYLSPQEKDKSNRFIYEHLRSRYIISHGILRVLLGHYLGIEAHQIEYTYNPYQKPFCKQAPKLSFNMSHSKDYACYIFSFDYKVGIDIEFINTDLDITALLPSVATSSEILALNTLNPSEKIFSFYKMWTLKEAFLKALGVGLSYPLTLLETSILPKEKFKVTTDLFSILPMDSAQNLNPEWSFSPIKSIPRYVGAIAINQKKIYPYPMSS